MNKFVYSLVSLLILSASMIFTSCSDDDDDDNRITVNFKASSILADGITLNQLEGMEAVFTEIRSMNSTSCTLNNQGEGSVRLHKGTYNVSVEHAMKNQNNEEVVVFARVENLSINANGQTVTSTIKSRPKAAVGQNFIFSEVFFNGETNSGRMMHPDQYFVVFNPTTKTLYADGLCIGNTQHQSRSDKAMWFDEFYNDNRVPVCGFVTIPGEGQDYPVAPGEKIVIAFTAIDHSSVEGYDNAVNLEGADFEIFQGADKKDVDNPDVANMLLTENVDSWGFFMHPRGYAAPLMFKLENGLPETIEAFYKANVKRTKDLIPADEEAGTPEQIVEKDFFSVETSMIIDGVQTGDVPNDIKTRVIPETVDRGKFLVNGCHRQELAIRKAIQSDNQTFYQDTNDSSADFIMQKGQNSFPKGWRNK